MADWKNNKVLGVLAGIIGVALIGLAISVVIKSTTVTKRVPPPKVELPNVK